MKNLKIKPNSLTWELNKSTRCGATIVQCLLSTHEALCFAFVWHGTNHTFLPVCKYWDDRKTWFSVHMRLRSSHISYRFYFTITYILYFIKLDNMGMMTLLISSLRVVIATYVINLTLRVLYIF